MFPLFQNYFSINHQLFSPATEKNINKETVIIVGLTFDLLQACSLPFITATQHFSNMQNNKFGGFCVSSPFGSFKNDPLKDLASNTIRDFFGPTCQTVADCILTRGPLTLSLLVSHIRQHCKRDINVERSRLVDSLEQLYEGRSRAKLNLARGSEEKGFVVSVSAVRAALIVLQHHSIVKATPPQRNQDESLSEEAESKNVKYRYSIDHERALFILRFPRYIEYARKIFGDVGACIIEEFCINGRMLADDVIKSSSESILSSATKQDEVPCSETDVLSLHKKIASKLEEMFDEGFIELVSPLKRDRKFNVADHGKDQRDSMHIPLGSVLRINVQMFHSHLRSFYLGRLVAERFGHVQYGGSIISSALKCIAHRSFARSSNKASQKEGRHLHLEEMTLFTPSDILKFLPPPVFSAVSSQAGGIILNLSATLVELSKLTYPSVIFEVEEAHGHPDGGKFEIATRNLLEYLRGRLIHQAIRDHHGDVPARICSILDARGHLEGEAIAESAMVPAKDAREMLHRLYKTNYISLLYLQNAKQHNPATAIYLWYVDKMRLQSTVLLNICRALCNLRQRRQHEVEVGKEWIERAKLADDENDVKKDKLNYKKFCEGLERLDNACIQLDESLMVLKDFD